MADPVSAKSRARIKKLTGGKAQWENLTIDLARHRLSGPDQLENLLDTPGFRDFLIQRSGKSRRRFEELLDLLFRTLAQGVKPQGVVETARTFTLDSFIKIERSFYMVPIDEPGCRMFDRGTLAVGRESPALLPKYLEFCRSAEFGFLRKEYEENRECLEAIFSELVRVILSKKKSSPAVVLAGLFIREGIPGIVKEARNAGEADAFARRLVKGFMNHDDPDALLKTVQNFGTRYARRPAEGYRRLNEAWPHVSTITAEQGKELREFISLYGKTSDTLQEFVWNTTFSLAPPVTGKAVTLFISGAFTAVVSRFRTSPEVLILLIKNLMAALLEMEIENLKATIFPIVMKLLLKLNIERRFLERRGKFFAWLKGQSSSVRVELEVIRLILFEYIFIATRIVPPSTPQKMTKFCDATHQDFCRCVDDIFGDSFAMRQRNIDDVFRPLLKTLRKGIWEAPVEKFTGQRFILEEIRSVAEDRDLEDRVLSALEDVDPQYLAEYHESLMDVFRRAPDYLEEAVRPDYWYRIELSRAGTHVHGAIAPLVGMIPVLPDAKNNAATDGRVIYLPQFVNFFTDPIEPAEANRNVSVFVALALHEAGHIIGGTFKFDLSLYMANLDNPELYHIIMNAYEDFRIEEVLRKIKAHPQVDQLLTMFNRYLSLELAAEDANPVMRFLLHTVDAAAGDAKVLLTDETYRTSRDTLLASDLPAGRFGSIKRFFSYVLDRLKHMDICNPLSTAELSRECYQVIITWPREAVEGLTEQVFGKKRPRPGAGEGADEPLNEEELKELYRQYNENPGKFLGDRQLDELRELLPGSESSAEKKEPKGSPANRDLLEHLEEPRSSGDYLTRGTMDFSTRTKADDLIARRQTEKKKDSGSKKAAPPAPRPKTSHVYSIDPKTKSRTRLSEIREYTLRDVDRAFMSRFRKWAYISHRVERYLAAMLPRSEDRHDLSAVDGELNMGELIEILSGESPVGQFNFLDIFQETKHTLEVVIGIDISGSTDIDAGHGDTILDVEKSFAMILGTALEHLTENVSLFGFNSWTSTNVYRAESVEAVSSFRSSDSNRDGDFIRYIGRMLEQSPHEIRYFFLISDGQPNAANYEGKEALDDTVIAMRETVKEGVKLIYLNVDTQKSGYFDLFRKEATYAEHFTSPDQLLLKIPRLVETVVQSVL